MCIWWYFAVVLLGLVVWVNVLTSFVLPELNMPFVSLFAISSTFYINSAKTSNFTTFSVFTTFGFFPKEIFNLLCLNRCVNQSIAASYTLVLFNKR